MTDTLLALPQSALAKCCLEFAVREESVAIANHSIRSFLFARLWAQHIQAVPGADYDPELLFFACVLHDIGLSEAGNGDLRFEVDGADAAARLLTEHGLPGADVDMVWDAIALHTSAHIAERRSALCQLTRAGISVDFGPPAEFVTAEAGTAIHAAYPRHSMATAIVDTIVAQATARPNKAPPFSPAAAMVRERAQGEYLTSLERRTECGRWGN